ncbi:unnamed protein product [Prunus armeniaca]
MGVDQNPFPNAQVSMVNANFQGQTNLGLGWTWVAQQGLRQKEGQGKFRRILRRRARLKCTLRWPRFPRQKFRPRKNLQRPLCYVVDANVR